MDVKVRGFDTSELFRKDTIERVRRLEEQIEEHKNTINEIKRRLPDQEKYRNENNDR